jgi:hypothetical protein
VPQWAWGFLLIVNPILVTLFQLRLTRRVAGMQAARRWFVAMLLMGLPFLALGASSLLPVIIIVLVLFVIGEMLWVPVSQSAVAGLAPEDLRGAYMGIRRHGRDGVRARAVHGLAGAERRGRRGGVGRVRGGRRRGGGAGRLCMQGRRASPHRRSRLCCT